MAELFHIRNEGESFEVLRRHGDRIWHVHLGDPDRRPPGAVDDVSLECRWAPDAETAEAEIRSALARVCSVTAPAEARSATA